MHAPPHTEQGFQEVSPLWLLYPHALCGVGDAFLSPPFPFRYERGQR